MLGTIAVCAKKKGEGTQRAVEASRFHPQELPPVFIQSWSEHELFTPLIIIISRSKTMGVFFWSYLFQFKPRKVLFFFAYFAHMRDHGALTAKSSRGFCIKKYDPENSNQRWAVKGSVPAAAGMESLST